MKYAFWSGGQSNMFFMQDYLESLLKDWYGPETILIKSSVIGSPMDIWKRGETPYDSAVLSCLDAIEEGFTIPLMAWNQGENDTFSIEQATAWPGKFSIFTSDFRQDAGIIGVPVVYSILGKQPTTEFSAARPGWVTLQHKQIEFLYGRPMFDRVDEYPFGPYAQAAPGCHYLDTPSGYQGIAKQYMRYITGRIPKIV